MAYTATTNTNCRISTNTEFQTWGSWISDAIGNTGLVQTADTGQIDWSTVACPSAPSTMQGYEIWRFNDALQSVSPVFLRIDYGSGSVNTVPAFRWTLGSGSTGNGTLSGFLTRDQSGASGNAHTILQAASVFANNTLVSYISGGNNWLILAMNARGTGGTTSHICCIGFERTIDANGLPIADGVLVSFKAGGNPAYGQSVWSPTLGWIGNDVAADAWGMLTPFLGGGTTGSNVAVYPVFHSWGGGAFLNPGFNFLGYWNSEITVNTANTFTYYGESHTYMPLGNSSFGTISARGNTQIAVMMRWE
jgi:hypothetical protein